MGHYAYVNENLIVENVIKCDVKNMIKIYGDSLNRIPGWFKTSYNTWNGIHWRPSGLDGTNYIGVEESDTPEKSLRKNYASVGYSYIPALDAFVAPKPYDSWIMNYETCSWQSPLRKNDFSDTPDVNPVEWDEDRKTWISRYTNQVWNDSLEVWEDQ